MDFLLALKNKRQTVFTMACRHGIVQGALTQQVFRAVCVIVVVVREMVDSVTAALVDTCRTKRQKD